MLDRTLGVGNGGILVSSLTLPVVIMVGTVNVDITVLDVDTVDTIVSEGTTKVEKLD